MVKFTAKSKYSNLKLEYLVKTKLVAKLFNLAQRFVQELTETNVDIET